MSGDATIDTYLRTFRRRLSLLPTDERDAIVAEIASHLEHRRDEGRLDEAMASLGSPAECAQRYADDFAVQSALGSGGPVQTIGTLATLAARRTLSAFGLLLAGLFMLVAIAMAASVVIEFIAPSATGLWVGNEDATVFFGVIDQESRAGKTDVLGAWYAPVAMLLSVAAFLASQWIGRLFLRLQIDRRRPTTA